MWNVLKRTVYNVEILKEIVKFVNLVIIWIKKMIIVKNVPKAVYSVIIMNNVQNVHLIHIDKYI